MEARLDDLLSRIAMETDEIKELEQQLTDGQILANKALQRDLKEVICGLQEYLRGLGQQTCSQLQADRLQDENQRLQRFPQEARGLCRQQEEDRSQTHTKVSVVELSALWMEAQSIRDRQTQLEAGLLQLREELTQQVTLKQEGDRSPQEVSLRLQAQLDQNRVHFNYIGTQLDQFTSTLPELQTDPEERKNSTTGSKQSLFFRTAQHTGMSGGQLQARLIQDQGNSSVDKNTEQPRSQSRDRLVCEQNPAPSLGSQGTQDSGLELQFPSSPDRGQQQGGPSAGGGYWVFVPMVRQERECVCSDDQNNDGLSDRSSRGGSPPPPPPASAPVTAAAASAGVTDARTSLRGSASPSSKSASLRCRPPKQKHTEDAERLKEKKELQMETKWLRHKLRQHRCVLQVCDELACLEETLLKRRAELRESDRLLLEAERLRDLTGGQVDVLLLRRLTSTSSLLEAAQHLRELRRRREEEQLTLWEVEAAIRSRHQEFKQLDTKMKAAANRLAGVLSDCQEARRHLESLTCQEKHKEQRLARMKEEHRAALGQLAELREEQKLQSIIEDLLEQQEALWSKKSSTVSDVRSEEQKLVSVKAEHRSHRAELKRVLREEWSRMQEQVAMKRKELSAPQQLGQKDVKQLQDELQVQEKLNRRRRKRSSQQEQCRQLETRRRHADRRLSVLEAERSHTHFIK
ncbi:trichohyalin isoform X2 [Nothobranchius furzeri]|uniref:Transcript variant X3 n=1 Tax=Nothobranchius furzeri TaxID=105023 RepID=A0A9D3BD28_NOTFU|nr:transcript variant X3 [Nothobranchius furzeri]